MSAFTLNGKKILVTGASSGIGRQAAINISNAGGTVILTARDPERLNQTLDLLHGEGHHVLVADLSVEKEIDLLVSLVDKINGMVNCAGIVHPLPVKFITMSRLEEMNNISYNAPVLLTGKLLKAKKISDSGSLVYMSSVSSRFGYIGGALYCGAKAGIDAFVKVLALECASNGIRSNTINAAMVRTPLFDKVEEIISKEEMAAHEKKYPLGLGEPSDIANAIVFLLSDASRWITGTNLVIDGGLYAG